MKKFALRTAIKVAIKSKYKQYKHGCVLEAGGRIISTGVNASKIKHPKFNKWSTHAETAAILAAGDSAKGCNLYVVRVSTTKYTIGNSKPCAYCQLVIQSAGIKKVFYSITDHEWGTLIV